MATQKETNLKNQILDYLKYNNVFCWLTNTQGNYNKRTGTYYKNPRLMLGVADILGITKTGRFFAIECKVGKNKQTDTQQWYQLNIEANNGIYILAYDLETVKASLKLLKYGK